MGRKVFLSFLGTSSYSNIQYYFDSEREHHFETPFIQEAILKYLIDIKGFKITPKVFLTGLAKVNWEKKQGLKEGLNKIDSTFESSAVEIPDGKSKEELLMIFLKVYEHLNDGDEVYFDITHGFRSLPMLTMVFLNYAKFLKSISVKAIYYGAFDAKQAIDNQNWAPVWNLTYFSTIQDWTNAANQFLQTGNGLFLSDLIEAEGLENLKESISNFTKEILVNRGVSIYHGKTQAAVIEQIESIGFKNKDPLNIILKKVQSHFKSYNPDSISNGLNAVKWCIDNGLIQQGATLLEEFATTYVLHKIGKIQFITDKVFRGIVSSALSVPKKTYIAKFSNIAEDDEISLSLKNEEEEIISKIYSLDDYKKISETVRKIKKSIRDDINHAGFRDQPRTYDEFKESLQKRYKEFLKMI